MNWTLDFWKDFMIFNKIIGIVFAVCVCVCVCAMGGSMSNLLMQHHAIMASLNSVPKGNFVHIGEHDYPYADLGNGLLITTLNLYENVGESKWPDNNEQEAMENHYGRLYRPISILNEDFTPKDNLTSILPAGWRVPKIADYRKIRALDPSAAGWRRLFEDLDGSAEKFPTNFTLCSAWRTIWNKFWFVENGGSYLIAEYVDKSTNLYQSFVGSIFDGNFFLYSQNDTRIEVWSALRFVKDA